MTAWRALTSVALLGVFYVLALSMIIIPIVLLTAGLLPTGGPPFPVFVILLLPSILAGIGAVLDGLRIGYSPPAGSVAVSPSQAPLLWATVAELAAAIGTRPPADLRLTIEPAAEVRECAWFLGLVGGQRHLHVGVPLLATLSVSELRAVLAHELAHYARHHTRLKPIAMRGWISLTAAVARFSELPGFAVYRIKNRVVRSVVTYLIEAVQRDEKSGGTLLAMYVVNWFFGRFLLGHALTGYARLYQFVAFAGLRADELAADEIAVHLAGRQAMDRALRTASRLDRAWALFASRLVAPAIAAGFMPEDVFGAFNAVLTNHTLRAEVDTQTDAVARSTTPADHGDTHPPLGFRLQKIAGLSGAAVPPDPRPATALLPEGGAALIAAVRDQALQPEQCQTLTRLPTAEWTERVATIITDLLAGQIVSAARWANAVRWVNPGTGRPTLASVVAAVAPRGGAGALERMTAAGAVFEPNPAGWARLRLHALIGGALIAQGAGSWRLSWAGPSPVVWSGAGLTDGELWDLAAAAALTPDGAAWACARLTELGLDIEQPVRSFQPAEESAAESAGFPPPAPDPEPARRRTLVGPVYLGGVPIDMGKAPRPIRYLLYAGMIIALVFGLVPQILFAVAGFRIHWALPLGVSGLLVGVGLVFAAVFLALLVRLAQWLRALGGR